MPETEMQGSVCEGIPQAVDLDIKRVSAAENVRTSVLTNQSEECRICPLLDVICDPQVVFKNDGKNRIIAVITRRRVKPKAK